MSYNNPYLNPYQQYPAYQQFPNQQIPQQQVTKVNGENGARAYPMGANSSALLLDESGTMIWLCTTDGASYKTVSPYDISPHQAAPMPDYQTLESRISRLEELINADTTNSSTTKRKPKPDISIASAD